MGTFLLFAIPFSLVGWLIYTLLRYTSESVGEESPLKTTVIYQYDEGSFLKWRHTPLWLCIGIFYSWVCWVIVSNLATATSIWHYVLTFSSLALCVVWFYLLNLLFLLEEKLCTIVDDTALELDPATKSITVHRAGTSTVLTASTVALIESHLTAQGKLSYWHFRFVDHDGQSTFFYDYGKGLRFAIEAYFKDVPTTWVKHKFPFKTVLVA